MNSTAEDKFLYHYCSNETMVNIVKKKQIWMTDISRSNDFNEMKILLPDIYYATEFSYKENPFEFIYKEKFGHEAIQKLLEDTSNKIRSYRKDGRFTSFVACFSEEGDVLSQWRGYANNAKGCSVAFSMEELRQYCHKQKDVITVQKVEYINPLQAKQIALEDANILLDFLKKLRTETKSILSKKRKIENTEIDRVMLDIFTRLVNDLLIDSLRFKWETFKEEKEWRMYFRGITKDEDELYAEVEKGSFLEWCMENQRVTTILHGKVDFLTKDNCLIPYYPIELMELSETPIKEVIIGSKNLSYIQDYRLLFAKEKMGKPNIKYSQISYR